MSTEPRKTCLVGLLLAALLVPVGFLSAASYVVDQNNPVATDDGPGTAEKPWKTISKAATTVQAGDTVTVAPGIYREEVRMKNAGTAEKPIVIQAAKNHTVIISGADVMTGWEREKEGSDVWVLKPWTRRFQWHPANEPAGRSELVFVDGMPIRQVLTRKEMKAWTFCADPDQTQTLYLWPPQMPAKLGRLEAVKSFWNPPPGYGQLDPNKMKVEVGIRQVGLILKAHTHARGFVVRHCPQMCQNAALIAGGKGVVLEDCISEWNNGTGINISGEGAVLRRCITRHNGQQGITGSLKNGLVEDLDIIGNNWRLVSWGWEAGGSKFTFCRDSVFRRIRSMNNNGPGIWWDISNENNIIEQCWVTDNIGSGIMVEISPRNIIRNNVVLRTRYDGTDGTGILIQMSPYCKIYNNTCVDNAKMGIFLRYHPYMDPKERKEKEYNLIGNEAFNNILANNGDEQIFVSPTPVNADDAPWCRDNKSHHNLFWNRPQVDVELKVRDQRFNPMSWSQWGKIMLGGSYSLEEYQIFTGREQESIAWDPMFVDPQRDDYQIWAASPAVGAGAPVEDMKVDFLGHPRPAGRPAIGAYEPLSMDPPAAK